MYDGNGNLISKTEMEEGETEIWTYAYDGENRLISAVEQEEDETKTVTFKYDPFGRRIEKQVTEEGTTRTRRYFYDNEDILFEYDENGVIENRYLHGPGIDEPLSVTTDGGTYYYHADGLSSIIALTDADRKVVQEYEYDAFGNLHDQKNAVKQPYTYTGREWDKETKLYYYRARYYDAKVGRFISSDPIVHPANGPPEKIACGQIQDISIPLFESLKEDPQKLNPYIYVENRPTILTDPTGLGPPSECSYYKNLCDSCEGGRYPCIAYKVCKTSGDNPWSNCVRNCLLDAYKQCNTAGCITNDHVICWSKCSYQYLRQ